MIKMIWLHKTLPNAKCEHEFYTYLAILVVQSRTSVKHKIRTMERNGYAAFVKIAFSRFSFSWLYETEETSKNKPIVCIQV